MTSSSPFHPVPSQPGHGAITLDILPPSHLTLRDLSYTYPLKLISPRPSPGARSILVFLLTYGGGLVAGDRINLSVAIETSARLSLVTQGSTKIFKSPRNDLVTRQTLDVRIESGGALVYLPDPVQPFAESVYEQRQLFHVVGGERPGSLCVLDWVSEGRSARGEKWDLTSWKGRNEVYLASGAENGDGGRLLLRDNVLLTGDGASATGEPTLASRMDGLGVFGTLILRGPLFSDLGAFFLHEFSSLPRIGAKNWTSNPVAPSLSKRQEWRAAREKRETRDGLLWTAAAVRGLVVVKFGAREVEGARQWLRTMMMEEGTLQREFGEGSLLCLA